MSLGDRLCASREGGAGGGGWVHPKGADSMAVFGLSLEEPLVGAQRATSALLCTNGLRKQSSRLVGPPFLAVKHFLSLVERWSAESRDYWMSLDGWVWLKSRKCRGLLQGQVCGVWGLKS